MSDRQHIEACVRKAAARRRWQRCWLGLWRGLLCASILWILILAIYKFLPVPLMVLSIGGLLAMAAMVIAVIVGGWRRDRMIDAARWMDQAGHFQEKVSTAWELSSKPGPASDRWSELVMADAAQCAPQFDARKALAYRIPAWGRWIVLLLAVGASLGLAPEYRSAKHLQKQKDAEVIREMGRQLAGVSKRQIAQQAPNLPQTRENLESAGKLGDLLTKAKLTRAEALKDVANMADKLRQEARQLASSPALKRMEQAARTPSGLNSAKAQSLQKQMESLQEKLGKPGAKPEDLENLKKELEKAQEAASGLAGRTSASDNSAAQKEELSKNLASLAQRANEMGLSLPGLQEAIAALAADQTALLVKDLENSLKDLDQLKAMAENLQQLQQQAEGLAKDLAEQLQKGQAEAAKNTLEKMVEALKKNQITPGQIKTIMEEVAKAVAPAKEYGKVADLLKQSVDQMRQSQSQGAAQSLAEAAKELDKLLAEMGDMESLKAMLAALQKAQMCIGSGECFGQYPGRIAKGGKGGKPGRGFGTWADEEGWLDYPEISGLWENPADNRGQLDSRSATDRGDGQLADNLDPTRLRGKISPGNSMPSINLKGVSIKGMSKVAYEEATMAAQADAQSALAQEQIPKAYQNAVKDYFDDIKK